MFLYFKNHVAFRTLFPKLIRHVEGKAPGSWMSSSVIFTLSSARWSLLQSQSARSPSKQLQAFMPCSASGALKRMPSAACLSASWFLWYTQKLNLDSGGGNEEIRVDTQIDSLGWGRFHFVAVSAFVSPPLIVLAFSRGLTYLAGSTLWQIAHLLVLWPHIPGLDSYSKLHLNSQSAHLLVVHSMRWLTCLAWTITISCLHRSIRAFIEAITHRCLAREMIQNPAFSSGLDLSFFFSACATIP